MSKEKGLIYILTNPAFPNYQKIGKTTDLKGRLRSLNDKTCLPFSFRVYATYELEKDLSEVEDIIFNLIDNIDDTLRACEKNDKGSLRRREFFAIEKDRAFSVLQLVARLRKEPHKAKLIVPTKKEAFEEALADEVEEVAVRREGARFSFAKKGIPLGASINFINDITQIAVTLEDYPPIVMFKNKKWKLSPLVAELKRRDGTSTASESYQGAAYFTYNGVRLVDMPDVE